jgi:hypothetical protein
MPKYKMIVQMIVDAEASDIEEARKLIKEEPPFVDVTEYFGKNGTASVKSRKSVDIISVEPKGRRKAKTTS